MINQIKSLCVYCGASNSVPQVYKDAATALGKHLAENGIKLVFGGGGFGLMGLVSNGAMDAGGHVSGYLPQHLDQFEGGNDAITELYIVNNMHERKHMMFEASDGFIILPGGFGTLDEVCEILTWKQIRLHNKPIVIFNVNNYWSELFDKFVEHMIAEGFVSKEHLKFFKVINNMEDILPYIAEHLDMNPSLVARIS